MEECSVLIESTLPAEDKTSRWFNLPIDYELFHDLLGVEADSKDYQIIDMKLPFAGDIVRSTSVRRLNKLYFAYTDLSPEVQQAYKELISYCGGVGNCMLTNWCLFARILMLYTAFHRYHQISQRRFIVTEITLWQTIHQR